MQKLFDDQVQNIDRDRATLMGTSDWTHGNLDTIEVDPTQRSVGRLRADQRRMLGGKQ